MASEANGLKLSPYLNVKDAARAIDFYCEVFGATEMFRLVDPGDGRIGHAQLQFGDTLMMLSDEYPDYGALGPAAFGGAAVKLHLSVDNVDETFARAIEKGAVEVQAVEDQFYGSRSGVIEDPFGHVWHLDTEIEEVTPETMQGRWNEAGDE